MCHLFPARTRPMQAASLPLNTLPVPGCPSNQLCLASLIRADLCLAELPSHCVLFSWIRISYVWIWPPNKAKPLDGEECAPLTAVPPVNSRDRGRGTHTRKMSTTIWFYNTTWSKTSAKSRAQLNLKSIKATVFSTAIMLTVCASGDRALPWGDHSEGGWHYLLLSSKLPPVIPTLLSWPGLRYHIG